MSRSHLIRSHHLSFFFHLYFLLSRFVLTAMDSVTMLIARLPNLNKVIFTEADEIVKSAAAHSAVNAVKVLPT